MRPHAAVALVTSLALVLGAHDARAQDAGCPHPDPTTGCPRTAPYTTAEVRAQLAFGERSVRRCAWEFLGTHSPTAISVTVPHGYAPGAAIAIQPTTFGAPPAGEQRFLECVAFYASPSRAYGGRSVTVRMDLRLARPMPSLAPAVTAALRPHAADLAACLAQGLPASALLVNVDAHGALELFAIRSPAATYDSSRGVPLGCAGYHVGRLSVAAPGREASVEIAWPLP